MTQTTSFAVELGLFAARKGQITGVFAMHNVFRRNAIRFVLVVAAALFATSTHSFATEAVPLAIKGYDPVAYFTIGSPTRGLPEIEYEWDEHRYLFANAEHRELFKADPVRYAPEFGNFCAMALALGELEAAIRLSHSQFFSSRLSSLRKRQSVPLAIIVLGLDLIRPASWSRNA